ncbi:MAG: DJ-1/PfpI family protein [Pseudomonadota bacterium]
MQIGLLLFPRLTQLDLTGPLEVFSRIPNVEVQLVWKSHDVVAADRGMRILPTHTFADTTTLDVICVPGGPGQIDLMNDEAVLQYVRDAAAKCRWITSVCTGSLVLAAAGLLNGYRATSHWSSIDQLAMFGAIPTHERVVRDRNRITGAGVTSGIDFALTIAAELLGVEGAEEIQLQIEYDPQPPFASGSPRNASPELLSAVSERIAPFIEKRRRASEVAARRQSAED